MAVAVIQGVIKSCGGHPPPRDVCYDYHPESNTWVNSASMMQRRWFYHTSFIQDLWLISGGGGGSSSSQAQTTTEKWTGSAFEAGPTLPRSMYAHCQLTLNATHVFFANPRTSQSYLLNWPNQTWTELSQMTNTFQYPSCGLINNPTNGREAVVVQNGISEIFNFNNLTWRAGPDAPYFYEAGFSQLFDTFVVVGGIGSNSEYLDTLYKFDQINYAWIQLTQQLQTATGSYPGVATVPDSFVNCN